MKGPHMYKSPFHSCSIEIIENMNGHRGRTRDNPYAIISLYCKQCGYFLTKMFPCPCKINPERKIHETGFKLADLIG